MAIVSAPTSTPFDNLDASTGSIVARSGEAVSINFTQLDSKAGHTLKLSGAFDGQGRPLALDQAVYTVPDGSSVPITFGFALSSLNLDLATTPVRVDRLLTQLFADPDVFTLGDAADAVNAGGGNDVVFGNGGNDRLMGGAGDDALNGGSGIDTAVYTGPRSNFQLRASATGFVLNDVGGSEGSDTLTSIERLAFSDTRLALDLDGNAGKVAKLLGAVFGVKSLGNREYVGIGLSLLDPGKTSYEQLGALAVSAAGKSAPADVVSLLWTNVIGSPPTPAQAQPFIDLLHSGTSIGQLAVLAADYPLNLVNIDLVGLAKTGIEYS